MFRFVSSKKSIELKKEYLAKYNVKLLQTKLNALMVKYPDIKAVLPADISARKLLVGNFIYLTKVYSAFTNYLNGKLQEERTQIISDFVNDGFKYESHKSKIAKFLTDASNGFPIHNCVYCDLVDVTTFLKASGQEVRNFETEHVLDKGLCPLVALSLYNFVPSCGTCNGPALKGTNTIGDTEAEIVKLSPSSEGYDFNGKVTFEVKIVTPGATDLRPVSHKDDFEIDFNVMEDIYQKSIDLFELKSRYNALTVKTELLKWWEKRRSYPDNIVQQMADMNKISFEEQFEDVFELDLRRREHYPKEKARREVMML